METDIALFKRVIQGPNELGDFRTRPMYINTSIYWLDDFSRTEIGIVRAIVGHFRRIITDLCRKKYGNRRAHEDLPTLMLLFPEYDIFVTFSDMTYTLVKRPKRLLEWLVSHF